MCACVCVLYQGVPWTGKRKFFDGWGIPHTPPICNYGGNVSLCVCVCVHLCIHECVLITNVNIPALSESIVISILMSRARVNNCSHTLQVELYIYIYNTHSSIPMGTAECRYNTHTQCFVKQHITIQHITYL